MSKNISLITIIVYVDYKWYMRFYNNFVLLEWNNYIEDVELLYIGILFILNFGKQFIFIKLTITSFNNLVNTLVTFWKYKVNNNKFIHY